MYIYVLETNIHSNTDSNEVVYISKNRYQVYRAMNLLHITNFMGSTRKNTGLKSTTSKYKKNRLIVVVAVTNKRNKHDTILSKIFNIIHLLRNIISY